VYSVPGRHTYVEPLEIRFWRFVEPMMDDRGCWIWTGNRAVKLPYGRIRFHGKMMPAHRASWLLHRGPIPDALWVLHSCDNPPCVNPSHLFLGTALDNARDKVTKGRGSFIVPDNSGTNNGHAKLTESDVREIRARRAAGETLRSIGDRFGICNQNVSFIAARRTWRLVI